MQRTENRTRDLWIAPLKMLCHMCSCCPHSPSVQWYVLMCAALVPTDKSQVWLQSTCGAYELLFYDCVSGKRQPKATTLRDVQWSTWTATLGWPVQVQFQLLQLSLLQLVEYKQCMKEELRTVNAVLLVTVQNRTQCYCCYCQYCCPQTSATLCNTSKISGCTDCYHTLYVYIRCTLYT
jgi:hypothetical protein